MLLSLLMLTSGTAICGPPAQASADGYLATRGTEVMFIQLTRSRGRLSGQMQVVSLEGGYTKRTKAQSMSFSGVVNTNNQVSLIFKGFLMERTIVGTLSRDKLSLSLPQADGRITVIAFERATIHQYNASVAQLQRAAANANRELQQVKYEKEVNENISHSLDEVSMRVKQLSTVTTDFDKKLDSFREHYFDMESHERKLREQLAANPPARSDANYSLSNITYDRSNIRYDRNSLDDWTHAVIEWLNQTRQSLDRMAQAWEELQTAIAQDKRRAIRRDVSQELISSYVQAAASEIRRVDALIRKADADAKDIEKQADDLSLRAKESYDRARKDDR